MVQALGMAGNKQEEVMGKRNLILIGMPGAGKSTVGVLLAKALGKTFIDTDLLIQKNEGRLLQDIINSDGLEKFLVIEEKAILGLNVQNNIIATGGSVVYSRKAMEHLKHNGIAVYLKLGLFKLTQRLKNMRTRGIAMKNGQSLDDLYRERTPLYEKYADITIDCSHKHIEKIILEIKEKYFQKIE